MKKILAATATIFGLFEHYARRDTRVGLIRGATTRPKTLQRELHERQPQLHGTGCQTGSAGEVAYFPGAPAQGGSLTILRA